MSFLSIFFRHTDKSDWDGKTQNRKLKKVSSAKVTAAVRKADEKSAEHYSKIDASIEGLRSIRASIRRAKAKGNLKPRTV